MLTQANEWILPTGVTGRLILVRHGEPEAAARGRCYGKLDVGLSELGQQQMVRTAEWLRDAPLSVVYASPRRRARESAETVAAIHRLDVCTEDSLCEIDFGEFEGLTYDEVAERYPEEYQAWMERPTEVTFPAGESFQIMQRRVRQAVVEVLMAHDTYPQTIAVIAHAGVCRIILADALRMRSEDIFRLDQSYAAISIIDYYGDTPLVRLVNRTP